MTATTCACGASIPRAKLKVGDRQIELMGLPVIFELLWDDSRTPVSTAGDELMHMVKLFNRIAPDDEPAVRQAVLSAYAVFVNSRSIAEDC